MKRIPLVAALALAFALAAFAQDSFISGSDSTLKWVAPDEGLEQMLEDVSPGLLYFYSSHKTEFCKAFEKEVIPNKSFSSKFRKYVCMKATSDAESELLRKYEVSVGEAVVLFLDCQGRVVEKVVETPDKSNITGAFRKTDKANKEIDKFFKSVEKLFKKGEAYMKKQSYLLAIQHFQAILKARDEYAEKKGEIKSPFFKKSEDNLAAIEQEGQSMLIRANAAINKNDFSNASILLSKLRKEFASFKSLMQKVEQAEQNLQRAMQRAQQQQGK